ncbi:MAG TPA: hypothetical protein VK816_08740, partial [Jatrophihabitantaceae bacterium]|nr:hypothetical protein [Jatrophihabitantaceae bacterium]
DPRAAKIIDRCDALSAAELASLHGILRDPHLSLDQSPPWWDPGVDGSVSPDRDSVVVGGVQISKGSMIRLHPRRRADAQDLFFDGQDARVTGVFFDVDGAVHIAVVLLDDPAADLHEWYGRYLYFSPDEIEPIGREPIPT